MARTITGNGGKWNDPRFLVGLFASLFLFALVGAMGAYAAVNTHGMSYAGDGIHVWDVGMSVVLNNNCNITQFNYSKLDGSATDFTRARIYKSDGTLLCTASSVTGLAATFSGGCARTPADGTLYIMAGIDNGVTTSHWGNINAAQSYPKTGAATPDLNWTGSVTQTAASSWTQVTNYWAIKSITCAAAPGVLTVRVNDTSNNALVTGFSFTLSNGSVSWGGFCNATNCANSSFNVSNGTLSFFNISGGTYYNSSVFGVYFNSSDSQILTGQSSPLIVLGNVSYANVSSFAGVNYTRVLSYAVNLSCPFFSTTNISIVTNGSVQQVLAVSCSNVSAIYSGSYQYPVEGLFNLSFYLSSDVPGVNRYFGNASFVSDLYNPTASNLSLNAGEGFVSPSANLTLRCTDSVMSNLSYNMTLNGAIVFNGSLANATLKSMSVVPANGQNNYTGFCADLFGNATVSGSSTLTLAQLILIDERTNTNFDVSNLTGVKAFFETASYMHDFKSNGSNSVFFQSANNTKIRVELTYLGGVVINRYVSVDLISSPIRVCANKEGVTHYEQLIVSASARPTILKNVFSNCVIGADYTRFAYQDALLLKAYSINSMYYLYTFEGDDQIFLASVDGSISSYVNIDVLEFKKQGYNIGVRSDALSFEKTGATTIQIYYKNLRNDNTALALNITRLDTHERVASTSDFTNPDEFTFYFDYSTLDNVTNETLFKITLTKTNAAGTESFNRYFNANAQSGTLRAPVAFAVAFLLVLFGLTLTMSRTTFGWFGIFIMGASLIVLSFAVVTWYITFLMAIDAILLVYICILLANQNGATVVQ